MWRGTAWCGRLRLLADPGSVGGKRRSGNLRSLRSRWGNLRWGAVERGRAAVAGRKTAASRKGSGSVVGAVRAGETAGWRRLPLRTSLALGEGDAAAPSAASTGKVPSGRRVAAKVGVCRCQDGQLPSRFAGGITMGVRRRGDGQLPCLARQADEMGVCRPPTRPGDPVPDPQPPFFAPKPTQRTTETRRGQPHGRPAALTPKAPAGGPALSGQAGVFHDAESIGPSPGVRPRRSSHDGGHGGRWGCGAAVAPWCEAPPRRSGTPRGRSGARRRRSGGPR